MKAMHVDKIEKTFLCDICPYKTHAQVNLYEHKRTKHNTDKIQEKIDQPSLINCPECGEEVGQNVYIMHFKRSHGTLPPTFPQNEKWICDQCPMEFARKSSLDLHVKHIHIDGEQLSYKCFKCNQDFAERRYYLSHYKRAHKEIPPEFKDKAKFICDQCPEVFLGLFI